MTFEFDDTFINDVEDSLKDKFRLAEETRYQTQIKVLDAMRDHRLSETDFSASTGYGYQDSGREKLEKVYARVFGAQDAIVRHQIVSGTHAITIALKACLSNGDRLLYVYDEPYDTFGAVIDDFKKKGITYDFVEAYPSHNYIPRLITKLKDKPKVCLIQRSRGYSTRPSLTICGIRNIIETIRQYLPEAVIIVDNCYGEFVEKTEPVSAGADLIAGSLIKNPGGGIALCGGYIAGSSRYVEMCEYEMTCPGLGRKLGATLGQTRNMFLGLFFAPHVVCESIKGAAFACRIAKMLGYDVYPDPDEQRGDIVQAIKFGSAKKLISFCRAVQKYSPVDSHLTLMPWEMPGYNDKIIMASGSFTQGSSIELSCDAPIREPYIAYLQGGLFYDHIKYAVINAFCEIDGESEK